MKLSLAFAQKHSERSRAVNVDTLIDSYLARYEERPSYGCKVTDLRHFALFLDELGIIDVGDVTVPVVEKFNSERRMVDAPATVARRYATLRHFLTFAERADKDYESPCFDVRAPRAPVSEPKELGREHIAALRETIKEARCTRDSIRNQTILECFLNMGVRISEVCVAKECQLDEELTMVRGVPRKGGYHDDITINNRLRPFMENWLAERKFYLEGRDPDYAKGSARFRGKYPIFISFRASKVGVPESYTYSTKGIYNMISGAMQRALIPPELCHPHALRHTFGHALLDTTKDLPLVSQALGHRSIQTTMRYVKRSHEQVSRGVNQLDYEKDDRHED